ncbi:MAG: M20 family metallopeptidase [Flavobacteriales bacterium]|nr:M20 family metallopeptidase [Flavobacteriales bacterium]
MIDQIKKIASKHLAETIKSRRFLHQNPELSFKEYNTSEYIQSILTKNKIPFTNGHVETGIIATIEGENPMDHEVLLRADMDALPILEENKVDYCSINKGKMHACGHDVHSASLIGTALILNELKSNFNGTIKLVFQPGEEKIPGGAKLMIKEGLLQNIPQACIAQHVYPDLPTGKVGFRSGTYMASADEIYVTIKGKGGHAALPHLLNDPILMASQIVTNLQQIVSRYNKPDNPSVLSFGYVKADGETNIIPDIVTLKGTFRTFDETWRFKAHNKMKEIANSICEAAGGSCDFDIKVGYPFLVNDENITKLSKDAAQKFLGEENVVDLDLRMTSEDFAFISQKSPSCFYRLGTGDGKSIRRLHTSTFDIDEKCLSISSGLMAYIALKQIVK